MRIFGRQPLLQNKAPEYFHNSLDSTVYTVIRSLPDDDPIRRISWHASILTLPKSANTWEADIRPNAIADPNDLTSVNVLAHLNREAILPLLQAAAKHFAGTADVDYECFQIIRYQGSLESVTFRAIESEPLFTVTHIQ